MLSWLGVRLVQAAFTGAGHWDAPISLLPPSPPPKLQGPRHRLCSLCTLFDLLMYASFFIPPPVTKLGGGILESGCPFVRMSGFCQDDTSWTAQPFVTKLSMVVYYHELESHVEKLVYLQGKSHSEGLYNKIWQFLLYLRNFCSICNQTWFDGKSL